MTHHITSMAAVSPGDQARGETCIIAAIASMSRAMATSHNQARREAPAIPARGTTRSRVTSGSRNGAGSVGPLEGRKMPVVAKAGHVEVETERVQVHLAGPGQRQAGVGRVRRVVDGDRQAAAGP